MCSSDLQGRRLSLDGEQVRSVSQWRADGSVLVFLPEELRAVKGPPAARRRHLDRLLEAAEPGYPEDLAAYGSALAQRNELTVDMETLTISHPDGLTIAFAFDEFAQETLVHGLDDIARTLKRDAAIAAYEAATPGRFDTRTLST